MTIVGTPLGFNVVTLPAGDGRVTEQMQRKGADKMQEYIDSLKAG